MSLLLLQSKTLWNDYFAGTTATTILYSLDNTSSQTPSGSIVYGLNCLCKSITSSSNGGALFCSTSISYLLVESTSFISCKTSASGGAIYFQNTNNGQSVLHEVCGYDCCTTNSNYYQFDCIVVKNDILSKNYVNYSSISRCVNENANAYQFSYHTNGKILWPSVNISNNKNFANSVAFQSFTDSNYVTCLLSYCSIVDNIATHHAWIIIWRTGGKYEIKSCNILRNTESTINSRGTITTQGNMNIMDSCILENKANYIFYQDYSSCKITISNCTVDSFSNNGYLTIQKTVTKSFILALKHMSTVNCHAGYDAAGTLTPITPPPPSLKNQKNYCTGYKILLLLRNEDIISLISILIFNFK
jgi:hypothetical protein